MPIVRIRYLKDNINRSLNWTFWLSILLSVGFALVASYFKQFELLSVLISITGAALLFLGFILAAIHQMRSTYYFHGGCATAFIGMVYFFLAVLLTYMLSEVLFPIFW